MVLVVAMKKLCGTIMGKMTLVVWYVRYSQAEEVNLK